jgi:nitrite reductase/ring-hydroxylating ferredoxin subunit
MSVETSPVSWKALTAEIRAAAPAGWYAVALSDEVEAGRVLGCAFLNGRVAVYRRSSGEPVVLTSRCPHMGADLALGDVVGDDLRCTYHHFCFGPTGACTRVPSEEPIPPAAKVFSYPCAESLGLVWAFNGEVPLFPPPEVRDFAASALVVHARKAHVFSVAPWISVGNSFDFLHLRHVHRLAFDFDPRKIRWLDGHQVEYEIEFDSPELGRFEQRVVSGTNVGRRTIAATTSTGSSRRRRWDPASATAWPPCRRTRARAGRAERSLREQEAPSDALLVDDAHAHGDPLQGNVREDRAMARSCAGERVLTATRGGVRVIPRGGSESPATLTGQVTLDRHATKVPNPGHLSVLSPPGL